MFISGPVAIQNGEIAADGLRLGTWLLNRRLEVDCSGINFLIVVVGGHYHLGVRSMTREMRDA